MRQHTSYCATKGTAFRIMKLGRLALGSLLPNGDWSTGEKPFTNGETIAVIFASKNGAVVYGRTTAVVEVIPSEGMALALSKGCYVATFKPIR